MPRKAQWLLVICYILMTAVAACSSSSNDGGTGPIDVGERPDSGPGGFLAPCDPAMSECVQGFNCFTYGQASVGSRCTKACSGPADCPAPSPGCNNMGVCKYQ